ncbi:protein-tyrosine phosphatase [Peptoclostridium litorale DSM 5388]|uniref:Low molecular weight phosphotyrosine phosphatase family protein n=1 Tax=Peptoclostridium litorale DSM 5388 TaxID=1121324 RepID=A0A069RDG4_PEPLI|nr:low molecular weight protein arginine phosphatase [Peptoclostridium litorale]KDR94803.1 Low molecular weight phosphotyrosine phosphatase family protein [Peptoclostridium litorale DSM 5388]SIN93033.1 protein-tyrosine phosphatase [Peptoclostridium litorale DSM 5388]
MNILFICTGNTCRSPMAEFFLKTIIKDSEHDLDIGVHSAGIATVDGLSATDNAVAAMKEYGIDISSHRSKVASEKLLCSANLILTMSRVHKDAILTLPKYRGKKIYTLKEFLGCDDMDVNDPFGLSLEIYKKTAEEIRVLVEKLFEVIRN